jgi:hypothetical protein
MPTCKCGRWFVDGAALRTHLHERHPAGRGVQSDRPEEVTDE